MVDVAEFLRKVTADVLEAPEKAAELMSEGFGLLAVGLGELSDRLDALEARLRDDGK